MRRNFGLVLSIIPYNVVAVHGDVYVFFQDTLHRCGSILDSLCDDWLFFFAKLAQHVGYRRRSLVRLTDTDTQSRELLCLYAGDNGTDAVVPGMAALLTKPDAACGESHLVIHDQQVCWAAAKSCQQVFNALSTVVHKCAGLCQDHFVAVDLAFAYHGFGSPVIHADIVLFGEQVDEPEAYVVPGRRVFGSWIAEADYDEHI